MKINLDFINKIFNLEMKITIQKDKDKLSRYEDYIPMYDIYSQKIYPISKKNIHYKLTFVRQSSLAPFLTKYS
jgi:hypothetical protein